MEQTELNLTQQDNQIDSCDLNPDFAVICSFIDRFGDKIDLQLDIERLKQCIEDQTDVSDYLIDLHFKLLKKTCRYFVRDQWEKGLIRFASEYSYEHAYEIENSGYIKSRPSVRLELLRRLLDAQFECDQDFKNAINSYESDDLRLTPLGRDANGFTYWQNIDTQCGLRVFREGPLNNDSWKTVCKNPDELTGLITELENNEEEKTKCDISEDACRRCDKTDDPECILLCDTCDDGYHTACCIPPLYIIPEGDWFCPLCEQKTLIPKLKELSKSINQLIQAKQIRERQLERQRQRQRPKPAENKLVERKPVEKKPVERKLVERKPVERRPPIVEYDDFDDYDTESDVESSGSEFYSIPESNNDSSESESTSTTETDVDEEDDLTDVASDDDWSIDEIVATKYTKSWNRHKKRKSSYESDDSDFKPRSRRAAAKHISYTESTDEEGDEGVMNDSLVANFFEQPEKKLDQLSPQPITSSDPQTSSSPHSSAQLPSPQTFQQPDTYPKLQPPGPQTYQQPHSSPQHKVIQQSPMVPNPEFYSYQQASTPPQMCRLPQTLSYPITLPQSSTLPQSIAASHPPTLIQYYPPTSLQQSTYLQPSNLPDSPTSGQSQSLTQPHIPPESPLSSTSTASPFSQLQQSNPSYPPFYKDDEVLLPPSPKPETPGEW